MSDSASAFGTVEFNTYFETVSFNLGIGGMRDVTSAIIRHERTLGKSAVFKLWMLYFQRISFPII